MPITFANLGASANPDIANTTDQASYANSAWTPPTTGLILLWVFSREDGATGPNVPTVSGNGLTWVQIATHFELSVTAYRLTLFAALAAGSSNGATTISFGGQTQTGCIASFVHADGVDVSGGTAASVIATTATYRNGTNASTHVFYQLGPAQVNNRPCVGWMCISNATATPRIGWTEADDLAIATTPNATIETQWRSDTFDHVCSVTWTVGGATVAIAVEVKAEIVPDDVVDVNYTLYPKTPMRNEGEL